MTADDAQDEVRGAMQALVTGASGFLGRRTVRALRARGHSIRAMVRPTTSVQGSGWDDEEEIEVVRADLLTSDDLADLVRGVDAVVHLAAAVTGTDDEIFKNTVEGTQRLLKALTAAGVKRLVLCSSFSVYNYRKIASGEMLTEESPLLDHPDLHKRNGYSVAKTWQERIVRTWAAEQGGALTVLRPGFIWGPDHEFQPCLGLEIGPVHALMSPSRTLALTYVENCADAIAAATEDERAIGETFNVVDAEDVTPAEYTRAYREAKDLGGVTLPVPYFVGISAAELATGLGQVLLRGKVKLPGLLVPHRFEPRFKPFDVSKHRLRDRLGWQQPVPYAEALARTYGESS
ncbi:MAG: NAD-dependent epimerase/dehydratase family protein [Myxococcota bacterium]